ncbi:MAG TPA: prolyl oligopeptidase family serine peptidase [Vicinamibacteria bacterium]|nr:prolyl oligopeptidase family serine peptidase [Vicinamibacteria bacterium]
MLRRAALLLALCPAAVHGQTRPVAIDDLLALKDVEGPQISPDGKWVAYAVETIDAEKDESQKDLWMVPFAGGEPLRLTSSPKSESRPRFSPDGRHLAFLSGREGKKTQVYLLDRQGGEAQRLTDFKGGVRSMAWSPDGTRLALVVSDPDPDEPEADDEESAAKKKKPRPIVIRRLKFKTDGSGYLKELRSQLHVFDLRTRSSAALTSGPYDVSAPAWSPDGRLIAFVSNRSEEPDLNENSDVFLIEPRPGAKAVALAATQAAQSAPAFSPDGRYVAYIEQGPEIQDTIYTSNYVAIAPVDGGPARPLTPALDRNVAVAPRFAPDGRFVLFVVEDGGNQHLVRVPAAGGAVERVVDGERSISDFDVGRKGEIALLISEPSAPAEIFAAAPGSLRRLTGTNDALVKGLRLSDVRHLQAKAPDGASVDYFLWLPPDHAAGTRLPVVLYPHGGPQQQTDTSFDLRRHFLAAQGYAVVSPNYRGSTGYGKAWGRAIWRDWGNKDLGDCLAAVDDVIARGIGDAERQGIGGWSYGGYLTNYAITKTTRFKAAVAGASGLLMHANYGTDDLQYWWETELGLPWKNPELWSRLSPFFDIEKVVTPTLVLCGSADMRVPLLNSEQLYQSLRRRGVTTELVIYPDEYHDIGTPSFRKDVLLRYQGWYDRYLKPAAAAKAEAAVATSLLGRPLTAVALSEATRKDFEAKLAQATADFTRDPDAADNVIWLGRRTAYLGRYREAIAIYTRGLEKHPGDARLLRHRGHRYITLRELDNAIADLEKARALVQGKADEVEPDGLPNPQGIPTSTLHFNIYYHLGLAHYLKGEDEKALEAYRACLEASKGSPDRLVATTNWLWMTLKRLGRDKEAAEALVPVRRDLPVIEDQDYLDRLLVFKGEKGVDELLTGEGALSSATRLYGAGFYWLVSGQRDRARETFERLAASPDWAPFAVMAAEAELRRMR